MPSKKVSMKASLVNRTSVLGIIGGLAKGRTSGASGNRATNKLVIPKGAAAGLAYMRAHGILSRNPLGSGGVGRMNKVKSCNCNGSKQNIKGKIEENVDEGELVPAIGTGDSDCSFLNQQVKNDLQAWAVEKGYTVGGLAEPVWRVWTKDAALPVVDGWDGAFLYIGDAEAAYFPDRTTCGPPTADANICVGVINFTDFMGVPRSPPYQVGACYKNALCPAGSEKINGQCTQCNAGSYSIKGGKCSSGFCEPCQYTSADSSGCYILDTSYCCSKTTWDASFGCTDANYVCPPASLPTTTPDCLSTNRNLNCTPPKQ